METQWIPAFSITGLALVGQFPEAVNACSIKYIQIPFETTVANQIGGKWFVNTPAFCNHVIHHLWDKNLIVLTCSLQKHAKTNCMYKNYQKLSKTCVYMFDFPCGYGSTVGYSSKHGHGEHLLPKQVFPNRSSWWLSHVGAGRFLFPSKLQTTRNINVRKRHH